MHAERGRTLRGTFAKFCKNSQLHGIRYLFESDRPALERYTWWIIQILTVYFALYLLTVSWDEYGKNPTVTTLENKRFPIRKIEFPAIAVCNLNKISKGKAAKLAKKIANKIDANPLKILQKIKLLGKIIDYKSGQEKQLSELQKIFNEYFGANKTDFDGFKILQELAPNCSELISDCFWGKNSKNDSCDEFFFLRATSEGFCCIFNYISGVDRENNRILKNPENSGIEGGLRFTLTINSSDFFYAPINSIGISLHIFYPKDFPDSTTGGQIQQIIGVNTEVSLRIFARKIYAVPEITRHPVDTRQCLFRNETNTIFDNGYSYSDCLIECRIRNILSVCNCVPSIFYHSITKYKTRPQCDLDDLICLNQYKEKWNRIIQGDLLEDFGEDEGVNCNNCYPSCTNTFYTIRSEQTPVYYDNKYSTIKIFFPSKSAQLYKKDVTYYWYEIISNFGGICSLFLGFSLMTVVEFVYYFTSTLWYR